MDWSALDAHVKDRQAQHARIYWENWLPDQVAQLLYRKVLFTLHALHPEEGTLSQATMILPLDWALSGEAVTANDEEDFDETTNEEILKQFRSQIANKGPKWLVRFAYEEPHPHEHRFGGALVSMRIDEAVDIDQLPLVLLLSLPHEVPQQTKPTDTTSIHVIGLVLPKRMKNDGDLEEFPVFRTWAAGVEGIFATAADADYVIEDETHPLGWRNDEARLVASTIPAWIATLREYVQVPKEAPALGVTSPPLPPANLSFSRQVVAPSESGDAVELQPILNRSFLPQIFSLVQRRLSPNEAPEKSRVACQMFATSSDGRQLQVIGSSLNHDWHHTPPLELLAANGQWNWNMMGISGRSAVREAQHIARFVGYAIPVDVRDSRIRYGFDQNMIEAVATPLFGVATIPEGARIAFTGLWAQRVAGVLYVYTRKRHLLPPSQILWLREFAGLLSEHFGRTTVTAARDQHLWHEHETGYQALMALADPEETQSFTALLEFLYLYCWNKRGPQSTIPGEDMPEGLTFIHVVITSGSLERTAADRAEVRRTTILQLMADLEQRLRRFKASNGDAIRDFRIAPYRAGLLLVFDLGSALLQDVYGGLCAVVHRYLAEFASNVLPEVHLAAIVFHHSIGGRFYQRLFNAAHKTIISSTEKGGTEINNARDALSNSERRFRMTLALRYIDSDLQSFRDGVGASRTPRWKSVEQQTELYWLDYVSRDMRRYP